jgi:hypothetical protein
MTMAPFLRGTAWAVAIAGLLDPVLTVERPTPIVLQAVTLRTASLDLPAEAGGRSRGSVLADALAALETRLGPSHHVRHVEAAAGVALDWCAGADVCIVAGDDTAAPEGTSVSVPHIAVVARGAHSPNVAVREVRVPSAQHGEAFGRVLVSLEGRGVEGRQTLVRVLDGAQERGAVTHEWVTGDTVVQVPVPWWPAGEGARPLTIEAVPFEGELSALDNTASAVAEVTRARLPVLVYEPRPSWAATFVRRALEADPRLQVEARSRVSPRTAVTTASAPVLSARALEDVALVVVGGLEALSRAEVLLLQQFVTRRGGSLLLLPDSLPTGPGADLVPAPLRERLVARATGVGPLRATELALTPAPALVDRVLATLDDGTAVIVESPMGHGRIVVSGAMDAWRHREAGDAFDAFWQPLAARLAADGGSSFRLLPPMAVVKVGERMAFEVTWRTLAEDEGWPGLTAWFTCEGLRQQPVTVWPAAASGTYRVITPSVEAGRCLLEVAPGSRPELSRTAALIVREDATPPAPHQPGALTALARSRGGAVVEARTIDELAAAVDAAVVPRRSPSEVRPLQAPWWMLLFAGVLGGEWWVRRRHQLR